MAMTFEVSPLLAAESQRAVERVQKAGTDAMRQVMHMVADWARVDHLALAGWDNESGNLERAITGYVAGDPESEIYPYGGAVPLAPFRRGSRVVTSQAYLSAHYQVDHEVSPPVLPVPGEIIGVLHHFMQYSNRLPVATGQEDIAVAAIEAYEDNIVDALGALIGADLEGD